MQGVPGIFQRKAMASRRMKRALAGDVEQEDVEEAKEHAGVGEVQVGLIGAEGGPDLLRTRGGRDDRQNRVGARADDLAEVGMAIDGEERRFPTGVLIREATEPRALDRGVVEDGVKHEAEVFAEGGDVLPRAVGGVDRGVVHDAETVVGGAGIKGEEVNRQGELVIRDRWRGQERVEGGDWRGVG